MVRKKGVVRCLPTVRRKKIKKFKETSSFEVKSGRGRKPIASVAVEVMATALKEMISSDMWSCSARGIARSLEMPVNTVHKILQNTLHCNTFKINNVQELHPFDLLV